MKENQNNLILIKDLGMLFDTPNSKKKKRFGLYKCFCGKEFKARTESIRANHTKSCGCLSLKHGDRHTRLYKCWQDMISRASNPRNKGFVNYGARGITVCDEWKTYIPFGKWAKENGYSDTLTLDRINPDGNYEPSNCRWATKTVQARNTQRLRKDNKTGYRGVSKSGISFVASIVVNKKRVRLGTFKCRLAAAYAYDDYVTKNNLEHTRNFN